MSTDILHSVDWTELSHTIEFLHMHGLPGPEDQLSLAQTQVHPCPFCEHVATSLANLRRHCTVVHHCTQQATIPIDFSRMAVEGLPTCSRCLQTFTTWRQFCIHVRRPCSQVSSYHPQEGVVVPPRSRGFQMSDPMHPALQFLQSHVHGSFILDAVHREDWDGLAQHRDVCEFLATHCVLCGAFANRPQTLNAHHRQHHHQHFAEAVMTGQRLTRTNTEPPSCHWCSRDFARTHTCNVFTQIAVMQRLLTPLASSPRSPLTCRHCGESFDTSQLLSAHLRSKHQQALGDTTDLDQVLPIPDDVQEHLRRGTVSILLQDLERRSTLTLTCQCCGASFRRATDLSWHLQVVHSQLWARGTELAVFLQAVLHPDHGCVCDPQPKQARSSHSCPGFRQLAMLFLRMSMPIMVPYQVQSVETLNFMHQDMAASLQDGIRAILLSREFQHLWEDATVYHPLRT